MNPEKPSTSNEDHELIEVNVLLELSSHHPVRPKELPDKGRPEDLIPYKLVCA